MIALRAVSSYVPPARLSNRERAAALGIDALFLEEKIGFLELARMAPEETALAMCEKAFFNLAQRYPGLPDRVDCVVVCTQNPDGGGIPHLSALLHGRLKFKERCACFDISLGCSGYVQGLSIACAFMDANGLTCGLLFTADPYSKIVRPDDRNTALIFGDAATVSLIGPPDHATDSLVLVANRFHTEGARAAALHNNSGALEMDGRAVFNFSARAAVNEIKALLETCKWQIADVDVVLLHQGSRFIVEAIRTRLDLAAEKVPFAAEKYGNTVSSSIPILLESRLGEQSLRKIILCGFGVGLSVATSLLQRPNTPS
jgi:3-oxoacyl-[acyl-carrier-protein] synthase-3